MHLKSHSTWLASHSSPIGFHSLYRCPSAHNIKPLYTANDHLSAAAALSPTSEMLERPQLPVRQNLSHETGLHCNTHKDDHAGFLGATRIPLAFSRFFLIASMIFSSSSSLNLTSRCSFTFPALPSSSTIPVSSGSFAAPATA